MHVIREHAAEVVERRRWGVLIVLTLVFALNYVDRQVLVILQESIKHELLISDTQLGLLSGLGFVLLYATLGVPIAYAADTMNRRNVIALAMLVWSAMTALCGAAHTFAQLLLARVGVGIGEAGATPQAHSLIASYFPERRRATALSIYGTGLYLGILVGFMVGGWIAQYFSWRMAFLAAALPAVLLLPLLLIYVKDPRRFRPPPSEPRGLLAAMRSVWGIRAFRYYALGGAVASFTGNSLLNFSPSYFIRSFGLSVAHVGTVLGLINGLGGLLGTVLAGLLADRLARVDWRWGLKLAALTQVACAPTALAAYLAGGESTSLLFYAVPASLAAAWVAPLISVTQQIVSRDLFALVTAIVFFLSNAVGAGLGPLFVGALSDALSSQYGQGSLRLALCAMTLGYPLAAILLGVGARLLPQTARAQSHLPALLIPHEIPSSHRGN
jgi:predicted MFS family arabinose efflux permease